MQTKIKIKPETTGGMTGLLKRFLALTLALIMLAGVLPMTVLASSTDEEKTEPEKYTDHVNLFLTTTYKNVDEKLATFSSFDYRSDVLENWGEPDGKPILTKDNYELYFHFETGEVAVKDTRTGQLLMSNPYDAAATGSANSADTRQNLMSQLILQYFDDTGRTNLFNTFKQAALNRQIKLKKIKGGIRVEYTIGKEEKRKMVPRMIERESFETNILQFMTGTALSKMNAYYTLKDANDPTLTDRAKKELTVTYDITRFYAIYIFDPYASERELNQIEGFIKQNTSYTFEMMDEDHAKVEYIPTDKAPPLFKMALEYYIDKRGMYMRLPANGIRFNESLYKLSEIQVLPFMGTVRRENTGLTFVPDGSGTLIRSEDIGSDTFIHTNKVYGQDYSFKKVRQGNHTKNWRLPVFGAIENYEIKRDIEVEKAEDVVVYYNEAGVEVETPVTKDVDVYYSLGGKEIDEPAMIDDAVVYYNAEGEVISTPVTKTIELYYDSEGNPIDEPVIETRMFMRPDFDIEKRFDGFIAVIEEGDVMADITTKHEGSLHKYNSVHAIFIPRPTDEYNLDFETKGINSLITVASRRKYAGNYIIRYMMISSDEDGNQKHPDVYEATYSGMAKAYRELLIEKGDLIPLVDDGSDIPLFIEALGAIETSGYTLGFPHPVQTPLTTFDDIQTMINELNAEGINNLKFRLNGWFNGGLQPNAPAKVQIEKVLGGKKGFQDMVNHAHSTGAEIYPDMDYALVWWWHPFDGTDRKKDGARYMDQLYATEQIYCLVCQIIEPFMVMEIIAPDRMMNMYDKGMKEYNKYDVQGISASSLARTLNSNHYKKSLVNRMDAKNYVTDLFAKMQEDHGKVLVDGANAYAFKYIDSALNVDLDSSRFMSQSESIPFYAMVTHGCVNIAGEPINMSGDPQYDMLKSIENGASPYYILSYQNSNKIKEDWVNNKYYSVDYTTWKSDILSTYKILNDALKSVRTSQIVNHEFLGDSVVRVTYANGTKFILNYNHELEATVDGHVIAPLDFVKIN